MADAPTFPDPIPVSRVFLWLGNFRHEPVETEAQAIEYLCEKENVYALARDIAKHGTSPLELFALVPVERRKGNHGSSGYYAAEGNRRLCALKLLNDPDLAPAKFRKSFEKLAEKRTATSTIRGAVFPTLEDAKLWLDRLHNGEQGGVGRRSWNSEQKQRASGSNKNRVAQALLDYAVSERMLTPQERKGKLTTVQRFVGNDVFREVLGLDQSNPEDLSRTRPKAEFDTLVKRFIRDLVRGKDVNSRMNKPDIIKYARPLASMPGVTTKRIEPESISSDDSVRTTKVRRKKPRKPEKARHVQYEEDVFNALRSLGNGKLESLYHSICSVELDPHTPLVAVGVWSFFETVTACAGRNEGTSFDSFLSKSRLASYGIPSGDMTTMRAAMERIRNYGNTTKHHKVAATFNGDQLNNDMIALKPVVVKCIAEAASKVR